MKGCWRLERYDARRDMRRWIRCTSGHIETFSETLNVWEGHEVIPALTMIEAITAVRAVRAHAVFRDKTAFRVVHTTTGQIVVL